MNYVYVCGWEAVVVCDFVALQLQRNFDCWDAHCSPGQGKCVYVLEFLCVCDLLAVRESNIWVSRNWLVYFWQGGNTTGDHRHSDCLLACCITTCFSRAMLGWMNHKTSLVDKWKEEKELMRSSCRMWVYFCRNTQWFVWLSGDLVINKDMYAVWLQGKINLIIRGMYRCHGWKVTCFAVCLNSYTAGGKKAY